MATRRASKTSNRSFPRRPPIKSKPSYLQGNPLDDSDEDYLNENLLGESKDNISSTTRKSADFSRQLDTEDQTPHRLVIAIDYGTTFTGVAFAVLKVEKVILDEVRIVEHWGKMGTKYKVPSVYSYSLASAAGELQWGDSLSPDAVTMVNTKLELDVQENKLDELELILQVLDGMKNLGFENVKKAKGRPDYTWKNPEEIVKDYMSQVFEYLNQALAFLGPVLKAQLPVDIVITVPVRWSYRAQNSTLRAMKKAGFNEEKFPNLNDIIMVSEPEAAAIYTVRYLNQQKKKEILKPGECFVLCDAGGGTVDIVSYKVTQLEPSLELKEMTIATSAKCGSAYIDANFKRWLSRILGERHYRALDPHGAGHNISAHITEGKVMRDVMKVFDGHKRKFSHNFRVVKLDLPEPLQRLNIPGKVLDGQITITNEEMKSFFDPCVDEVVELIQGQIQQVERKKNRVKNVFLTGGFGESAYLREELEYSLKLREITMQRPDTSLTAVVRGAVIYGIEKANHKNAKFMTTCPKNYGIVINERYSGSKYDSRDQYTDEVTNNVMARKQLAWLIQIGDLVLSDTKTETEKEFTFAFYEIDQLKFRMPIYEYPYEDPPKRFENGQEELIEVAVLNCDLSANPINNFDRFKNPRTRQTYYVAYLVCRMVISKTSLEVEILWNKRIVCNTKIHDIQRAIPRN